MGFKGFGRGLCALVLVILLAAPHVYAREGDALLPPPKQKISCKSSLNRLTLMFLTLSTAAIIFKFPDLNHDGSAEEQGRKHIGYAIYFSMDQIRKTLSPEESALLGQNIHHKKVALKVVEMFNKKLTGDYVLKTEFLPLGRRAEEFLAGQSKDRGVCRHKAVILAAILNELGLEARLQWGIEPGQSGHMWVYLPRYELVADPTGNLVMPAEEYYKAKNPSRRRTWLRSDDWHPTVFESWIR